MEPTNVPSPPTVPVELPGQVPTTPGSPPHPPSLPGSGPSVPANPWGADVVKATLRTQRLVYVDSVVTLANKKQSLLDEIAATEDTLQFVLKQINDLDSKINSA